MAGRQGRRAEEPRSLVTEDGGITWRKLSDESPRQIVQDPKSSRLYGIFGSGGEIRCSDDGGKNWRDVGTGLPIDLAKANVGMTNAHRFNAITTGPDFVVLANTVGDFFRLKSGSDEWQSIPRKSINYRGWFGGHRPDGYSMFGQALGSITVDPATPTTGSSPTGLPSTNARCRQQLNVRMMASR